MGWLGGFERYHWAELEYRLVGLVGIDFLLLELQYIGWVNWNR
jgi:hypothetical protein